MRFLLLFFLFTLPCKAQYLEFSISDDTETGEAIYSLMHEIYNHEEAFIRLGLVQNANEACLGEKSIYMAFSFTPKLLDPPDHTYMVVQDIFEEEDAKEVLLLFDPDGDEYHTTFAKGISLSDLKEINSSSFSYSIGDFEINQIHEGIDEFIKNVMFLKPCVAEAP